MGKSILFVCTGNTCRSVMAEYLLRHYANEADLELEVASAGLHAYTGDEASQHTVAVLKELGIDATGHRARKVSSYLLEEFDLILTMTNLHKVGIEELAPELTEQVFLLKEFTERNTLNKQDPIESIEKVNEILDPFGQSEEIYRQSREEIKSEIQILIDLWTRGKE